MIKAIGEVAGNLTIIGTATFATITQEDYRLWAIALLSLILANINKIWQWRQSRYQSMRERLKLCSDCKRNNSHPNSCVVQPHHRPKNCPLLK